MAGFEDEANEQTINSIDSQLARLETRINTINRNLHDGLFGEEPEPKDGTEVAQMPTPSIASLSRRVKELHDAINYTEDYTRKIHLSNDVPVPAHN